jgi:threonine dehydratase
MSFVVKKEVLDAEKRIREHIRETPLEFSPHLSQLVNASVYLKLESNQITGSFKLRGALNKFLSLTADQQKEEVITASSGNHAAALAYTLHRFGGKGIIYLPPCTDSAVRVSFIFPKMYHRPKWMPCDRTG